MFQRGWIFLLNAWRKDKALDFFFCLIQSRETQMDQSHFKMYFTTHNSCTYTLASSSLEAQPTETVGDRECYHLMLLYAYRISMFFCSWLLRGACWGIFLQLKWDWKISSCSGWIIVGNNLTHWVFVWGYCCLRVLLLKALCNILRCPQTQTDWQINFCLQIFDHPFHEGVYWEYSDFLNNYLKQTDADLNEICKTSFQHTVSQTCITAQFPPLTLLLLGLTQKRADREKCNVLLAQPKGWLLTSVNFSLLKALVSAIPLLAATQVQVKRHKQVFALQQTRKLISVISLRACNPSYSSVCNTDFFITGYFNA